MTDNSKPEERLVADGEARWWSSAEGIARLSRIEAEVRARHAAQLERSGWIQTAWIEWRIRREIAAARSRVTPPEILWLGR